LKLNLSGDNAGLLARPLALETIPLWFLNGLLVQEDLFEGEVEFAEIVLAEAVFVPADDVENEAVGRVDGQLFDCVPFGVECLRDGLGLGARVAEGEDEIGIGCATSIFGSEVPSLNLVLVGSV
jgi:hypothetical protein